MSRRTNEDEMTSFVACLLIDGGTIAEPITYEDAAYTAREWEKEGAELPEGFTVEAFWKEWNRQVSD